MHFTSGWARFVAALVCMFAVLGVVLGVVHILSITRHHQPSTAAVAAKIPVPATVLRNLYTEMTHARSIAGLDKADTSQWGQGSLAASEGDCEDMTLGVYDPVVARMSPAMRHRLGLHAPLRSKWCDDVPKGSRISPYPPLWHSNSK